MIRDNDVSGNVTSCEYSPTVGAIIGMAYTHIKDSTPGSALHIRIDNGKSVMASVVKLPFFDPSNLRQDV